jgi:hypothetical protein
VGVLAAAAVSAVSGNSQASGPSASFITVGWKAQIARFSGCGHLNGPCTVTTRNYT